MPEVDPRTGTDKFKVIIVGAGLGGCACAMAMHYAGFEVVVYEKIKKFLRLGDSLGLGENALRLLERWGCLDKIVAIGNKSPVFHMRRYDTGEILATQRLLDMAGYIGHRGDYHQAFIDRVLELGIPIHMGTNVAKYNEDDPSVTLDSGEIAQADIVIGADGIKSACRELVLGFTDKPKSSGYACYRAYMPGSRLKSDPYAKRLVEKDCMNVWIGPDLHIVQNTCKDGEEFNWIITHKDEADILESWSQPGDPKEAVKLVADWDPTIVNAMKLTETCLDWKIVYREPLPTWISRSGKVCLLGDSAHPHLPTSAQGASQAVEDSACLATCLKLAGKGNVRLATLTYERMRYARVLKTQKTGEDLRIRWHNALKKVQKGEHIEPDSIKMRNAWIYKHDAEADARERWQAVSKQIQKEMDAGKVSLPADLLGEDRYDIPRISAEEQAEIDRIVVQMVKDYPPSYTGRDTTATVMAPIVGGVA
ncbi:FAD/NAD(P)-binding domain-containing protein [Calocera cornea HHB12733]|uniref:FAD/NAD(P)-binding domain-containing protein n=1 Tax=Calocera cornea HHB12733 TaxID=1353952 RepID=A0A165CUQ5_9BASI|nr:FAD/NAD(P)-binding domain-containing protein [Calocera cornea HHB12733]